MKTFVSQKKSTYLCILKKNNLCFFSQHNSRKFTIRIMARSLCCAYTSWSNFAKWQKFYKLTCDSSACSWATMPYEASVSRNRGVLMWLPPSFTPSCSGMLRAEGWGGHLPPQILADQKAPPGSGGAPHYYLPPRIFDPWCIPENGY